MSMMDAIIARIGTDTGPLRAGLTEAVKNARWAQREMEKAADASARAQQDAVKETARVQAEAMKEAAKATKAAYEQMQQQSSRMLDNARRMRSTGGSVMPGGAGGGGGGSGGHGGGKMAMATQAGELLDSVTGQQGWVMRARMLARGGPIALAITAIVLAVKNTLESLGEMQKANEGLSTALKTSGSSIEGLSRRREALKEPLAEVEKSQEHAGFFIRTGVGRLAAGARRMVTGKDPEQEGLNLQARAGEEMLRLDVEISKRVKEESAARDQLAHGSETAAKHELNRLDTLEKIAKLDDEAASGKMGIAEHRARVQAVQQEGNRKDQDIDTEAALQKKQLHYEQQLLDIRREGKNVAVESASINLSKALSEQKAVEDGTDAQKEAAALKTKAAEDAYHDAKNARVESEAAQAAAMAIASLTGDADTKHLAALKIERGELDRQLASKDTPEDKKASIRQAIKENQNAQDAAGIAAGLKTFDTKNSSIDAGMGRGSAEAKRALGEKIINEMGRLSAMKKAGVFDEKVLNDQAATVAGMRRQMDDMKDAKAKTGRDSKVEMAVMEQQAQHHGKIAEAIQTQHGFEERIIEARKNGDMAQVADLQKKQQMAQQQQAANIVQQNKEALQLGSLDEIATHGHGRDASRARQALRLERHARDRAASGDLEGAKRFSDRAQNLKDGIRGLRDSEKSGFKDNFKGALDESQVLKDIRDNTKGLGKIK